MAMTYKLEAPDKRRREGSLPTSATNLMKAKPCEGTVSARANITERLAKTLVGIHLAKLKQIIEQIVHLFDDVLLIKKMPIVWRISLARSFPF